MEEREGLALVIVGFRHALKLLIALSLGVPFDDAGARSRFETGNPSPLHSRVNLDITILVPEFMRLLPSDEPGTGIVVTSTVAQLGNAISGPWSVVGNGGTIVSATYTGLPKASFAATSMAIDKAVDFTVAMP